MVKLKGPLLSQSAHGSIHKTLTYSKRKSGEQTRQYNKPTKTPTPTQYGQRRIRAFLIAQWQNMTDAQKTTWRTNAKLSGLRLPGYQYFLREAHRDLHTHHGLCAYWSLNKIVNNGVLDISGLGNNGTLRPLPPGVGPTLVPSKSTKLSNALNFNGVDNHINFGDKPIWDFSTKLSVSCLIKKATLAVNTTIIAKYSTAAKREWNLTSVDITSNQMDISIYFGNPNDGSYYGAIKTSVYTISAGVWYFIDFTYNQGTVKIYVNGISKQLFTLAGGPPPSLFNGTEALLIGYTTGASNFFKGIIDEVSIYNRVLSPAEITARYKSACIK